MRPFSRVLCQLVISLAFVAPGQPLVAAADVPAEQMIVTLLSNDDPAFRAVALDRVRHGVKGAAATIRVAGMLATLPAPRQIELIRALADRRDAAAIPAITAQLLQSPDVMVRAAAICAVGAIGSGTEVALLKKSLAAAEPEKSAARRALAIVRGDDAVKQIIEAAKFGEPALRPMLIEILVERRARSALPDFVALSADADSTVRSAAMRALGVLGGTAEVNGMIAGLLKAAPGGERQDAERAVVAVCTKNRGAEESAKVFLQQFQAASEADKESLLPALGGIGGPAALAIVDELIASSEPSKRQLGLKAISRWPDATVSQRLLDLVAKSQGQPERDMLLGALIRIAPLPDNKLNDKQKLDLVQKTMALCQKDEERARLIERANAIRTVESFRYVTSFLDSPALAEPACKSVVELAHHRQLRDANKEEFTKALDEVIGTTKNAELVERANAYKAGKTWERKKG
jgi:hypothetical protein